MNRINGTKRRLFGAVGVKKVVMMIMMLHSSLLLTDTVYGNNVRISGEPDVQLNATSDSLMLKFTLSWDNSWRDDFNWDAVWLFVKYKREGSQDVWSHLYLSPDQTGTANLEIDPGNTGDKIVGAFVYPKNSGAFNINGEQVVLKASLNGLSASDITNGKIYFAVQAIEMVLIPYGPYYLGDGKSYRGFYEPYTAERNTIRRSGYHTLLSSSVLGDDKFGSSWGLPNAVDANMGTHFHSAGATEEWFVVDFGRARKMEYFTIRTHYEGTGYYVEGTNDTTAGWTELWRGSSSDWSQTQSKHRITHPALYQYYRFRETGNYLVIYDVSLYEEEYQPLYVDSEAEFSAGQSQGSLNDNQSLSAAYPKGYKGFYMMKYELSQEQYVNFLNMLSYPQQKSRIGNNLDHLHRGDYVFGDPAHPSCRNGIAVFSHKGSAQPVVFGNNLNPADPFFAGDDGQTLACNYLTGPDMLAYLDWSGLRPLSELEYEKACRTPDRSLRGEYAWNTTAIHHLGGQSGLSASTIGTENEIPSDLSVNANAGNAGFGPVRCGSFGSSTSNQQQSGASFYGVMELSGNLGEMCYSVVGGSGLNVSSSNNEYHGDGVIASDGNHNVSGYWNGSSTTGMLSIRGGSFASPDSLLRVSDRSVLIDYDNSLRDSSVTFRGVRSISKSVDPGEIGTDATCPGLVTINSVRDASCSIDFTYSWYVKRPDSDVYERIEGESRAQLTDYEIVSSGTAATMTYSFRRKAMALTGEAYAEFEVNVTNMNWKLSTEEVVLYECGEVKEAVIQGREDIVYSWNYGGMQLSTGMRYTPLYSHFDDDAGLYNIVITASLNGCTETKQLIIDKRVEFKQIFRVCGDQVIDCRGNIYPTIQVGSQCWMKENLRRRDVEYCPVGDSGDIEKYGVHYYWTVVMNGAVSSSANPSGVQGICPNGWHIPSLDEWNELIEACGGASAAGAYMQSEMNMTLAGFGYGCSNSEVGSIGCYGSTNNDGYNNGIRVVIHKNSPQVEISQYMGATSYPYSYRCLKD